MGTLLNEGESDRSSLFVDINVTPLVDVMLVLLIIFMVTAPFMMETIGVNLPKGEGALLEGSSEPLTVGIDRFEKISIAGQSFDLKELEVFLTDSPRIKKGEPIFVEADEAVRHKILVSVMSVAHKAGALKINILMERP
jgi:biopolymer transport protein TolR